MCGVFFVYLEVDGTNFWGAFTLLSLPYSAANVTTLCVSFFFCVLFCFFFLCAFPLREPSAVLDVVRLPGMPFFFAIFLLKRVCLLGRVPCLFAFFLQTANERERELPFSSNNTYLMKSCSKYVTVCWAFSSFSGQPRG